MSTAIPLQRQVLCATPCWSWSEPVPEDAVRFAAAQETTAFSYADVGHTRLSETPPAGYNWDHNRALLGRGDADYAVACAALLRWEMFPARWARIVADAPGVRVGQTVAMQARAYGLWWLSACRIVYLLDEALGSGRRFGFAYGTLSAHVEQGEECFSVEQQADGSVWYDLRAFSRPRYWPVRLAKPFARRLQLRFMQESKRAMQQVVAAAREQGRARRVED